MQSPAEVVSTGCNLGDASPPSLIMKNIERITEGSQESSSFRFPSFLPVEELYEAYSETRTWYSKHSLF